MSQACIEEYFVHKKRKAVTQDAGPKKVLLLDSPSSAASAASDSKVARPRNVINSPVKCSVSVKETRRAVIKLNFDSNPVPVPPVTLETSASVSSPKSVKFVKRGGLSPKKRGPPKVGNIEAYFIKKNNELGKDAEAREDNKIPDQVKEKKKEPTLEELGRKLCKGGRLAELKNSIQKLSEGFAQLDRLKSPSKTALKEFKEIEVLVPQSPSKGSPVKNGSPILSPVKNILMSPRKLGESPIKSPAKVPAYQRLASLATPIPELALPHHYKWLAEVFRGIETASSMLHNRREIITFSKVKTAVQEMLKRNLTEKHLSQIKHLSPKMYSFSREKIKNFGATARKEEYELVLAPNLVDSISGSPVNTMTPSIILERRRSFHNLLLDKVKDHHSVYLMSLDPPMDIPKDKLKRWHPEFDIEHIPDIEMDALPEPPNVEKYSTAQDVLVHLKEKFNCNTRMERALQKLAEAKERGLTIEEQKVTGLNADGSSSSGYSATNNKSQLNNGNTNEFPLNPALKGIPKALLEKVRAKQAAKALESMTRSPAQEKNALTYQRLPDLAKLLRNLFVTEKKSVLPLELVISKLENSSRTKISSADLTSYIRTLASEISEWITFYEFRKTEHLKLKKDADMTKILCRLDELAKKHSIK